MAYRLHIEFSAEEEFLAEFWANIANGGIFVATLAPPDLRSAVEVEVVLAYRDTSLVLDGEVVHCLPVELTVPGVSAGVAIHFDDSLSKIRETFEPYTNRPAADESDSDHPDPRRARRFPASVPTRIRTTGQPEGEAGEGRIKDLSRYGALVAPYGEPTEIGGSITITITHPTTGEELEVDCTVMRHEVSESGEITGLGVEFHLPDPPDSESARFLEDVQSREHTRRLGAITGPIEELGISTLLSMFGTSSPCGTLTVTQDGKEGFVAFQGGMLRAAQLGTARGKVALGRMLAWRSGLFEFEARVDEDRFEGEAIPLEQALLEALNSQDERRREKIQLRSNTKLSVDTDAAEEAAPDLNQIDQAVIELAGAGMSVGKIVEVIPEPKRVVAVALSNLVKRGVISPA